MPKHAAVSWNIQTEFSSSLHTISPQCSPSFVRSQIFYGSQTSLRQRGKATYQRRGRFPRLYGFSVAFPSDLPQRFDQAPRLQSGSGMISRNNENNQGEQVKRAREEEWQTSPAGAEDFEHLHVSGRICEAEMSFPALAARMAMYSTDDRDRGEDSSPLDRSLSR